MSSARALTDRSAGAPAPRRRVAPPPELQVVEERNRRGGVATIVTLAGLALFVSLFGLAVFHALLVQGQSTLDGLDAQITQARTDRDDLRLQLAELEAPERILVVALEDLGMLRPDDVVVLDVRPRATAPEAGVGESGPAVSGDEAQTDIPPSPDPGAESGGVAVP